VNIVILLFLGFLIILAYYSILKGNFNLKKNAFFLTIVLVIIFKLFHILEYLNVSFNIYDGVYGTII
jgi:heme/copper-type cytochrome/quinol oxidase subunit 3